MQIVVTGLGRILRTEKFTDKMKDALSDAQSLAIGSDHASVEPGHVLSSLIADKNSSTAGILQQAGGDVGAIRDRAEGLLERTPELVTTRARSFFK